MKRLIALVALVAVLAGCAAMPDGGGTTNERPPQGADGAANGPIEQGPGADGEEGGEFELLRRLGTDAYSCNGSGAYTLQNASDTEGRVAVYTDFETCVRAPLCAVEGCRHNTDDCAAFFHAIGSTGLLACDDLLVWIAGMSYLSGPPDNPDGDPAVWVSDLDGHNRRLVLKLDGASALDCARAGWDGRYLYVEKTVFEETAEGETKRIVSIVKIDVASGETADEFYPETDGRQSCYFVGVRGGKPVVRVEFVPWDAAEGTPMCEYRLVDPADGSEQLLAHFEGDIPYQLYFNVQNGGEVLALTEDEQSLGWYDPAGGGFRETVRCPDEAAYMTVDWVTDGLVFLFCRVDGEIRPYIADPAAGEIYPAKLTWWYAGVGYLRPADILGVCGDDYFVVCGDDYGPVTDVVDGFPVTYDSDHLIYAMISRDDYRAGVPAYRYITEEG